MDLKGPFLDDICLEQYFLKEYFVELVEYIRITKVIFSMF